MPHLCASMLRLLGATLASLALVTLLPACAELPKNVERPRSTALTTPGDTPLGQWVQRRRDAEAGRLASGFALLSGPQAAYGARLALVQQARQTLDLQYYAIHVDASSTRLIADLREAAARGVRVRILLDDFHSTGHNATVMGLARVPGIEMRMFNPLAGARDSALFRILNSIGDAAQMQQRMHNKLFIADNAVGITGGRNLGDAYFGHGVSANFVDLDVLAAGPIVQDLSRSFDEYWNDARAYPVQSLLAPDELDALVARGRAMDAAQRSAQAPAEGAAADTTARLPDWDEQPTMLQSLALVWAPAAMLADRPAKIPVAGEDAAPAAEPVGLLVTRPASTGTRRGALAATAAAAQDDNVIDGLLHLFERARGELTLVSPYFVPGPEMRAAFAAARARGVRIRVLTNSLASNDAAAAHAGYARYRRALLDMGVELYELRSEQADLGSAFGSSGGSASGASRSMLHTKAIVIDRRLLVIGSMNLDLRSELQNTEVALVVRSDALSRAAMQLIEEGMQRAAWRVQVDGDGRLVWRAPQGSDLPDSDVEPDASLGLRLLIRLFGPLAPEKLL